MRALSVRQFSLCCDNVESQTLACDKLHHVEVCTLLGRGKARAPIRPITGRHSLSLGLMLASPTVSLAGHLPPSRQIGAGARDIGVPRSESCRPDRSGVCPSSVHLFPEGALTTCPEAVGKQPAIHLLVRVPQQLWLRVLNEDSTTVHLRCSCGTSLASTPIGCWQCRPRPCHQGAPSSEEYFVPGV
ncbi:hypothetical protein R69749_07177 [Paraburkholderia domus]|uniref:Uncharacterized protein n=1 Tax=Paraburkholderia domus TaxID=2793075 RepID=A0A9N8NAB2_9BURK|nr:hypothetical protein R69749_07177 [Paraburkholderia domus]CAE6960676.1 hypothetical protein R70199_07297 [Paraburkholderia domus]CAE6968991.1 hypothetical protein R70211_07648 [Paraburkholderia domus]